MFAASHDETHHSCDEYNTPVKDSFKSNISQKHVPAQQTAAKNPTFSHTSKNIQPDVPKCSKTSETFNKLEANIEGIASTGGKSMLACKPLLHKDYGDTQVRHFFII
jgi:hypothetical protein